MLQSDKFTNAEKPLATGKWDWTQGILKMIWTFQLGCVWEGRIPSVCSVVFWLVFNGRDWQLWAGVWMLMFDVCSDILLLQTSGSLKAFPAPFFDSHPSWNPFRLMHGILVVVKKYTGTAGLKDEILPFWADSTVVRGQGKDWNSCGRFSYLQMQPCC